MDMRLKIFQLSTSTSLIQTREVRAILQMRHGRRSGVGTDNSSHCSGVARRLDRYSIGTYSTEDCRRARLDLVDRCLGASLRNPAHDSRVPDAELERFYRGWKGRRVRKGLL